MKKAKKSNNTLRLRQLIAVSAICAVICIICMGSVFEAAGCNVVITQKSTDGTPVSTLKVKTEQKTVGEVLKENRIAVGELDEVNYGLDERVEDKKEIVIIKKTPVMICADGEKTAVATAKSKVGEILEESGIEYSEDDIVKPAPEENVGEDMLIEVLRVKTKKETRIEYTEPEIKYTDDISVESGSVMVVEDGVRGEVEITEEVKYADGEEIDRREISRREIKKAEPKIVARAGENTPAEKKDDGKNTIDGHKYTKKLDMVATAYSAFKPDGSWGTTAMGVRSEHGVVAVDKNVIPLGTKVYVEGYGEAVAADTGGAIKGNRIDLCFEDTEANLMVYGRQNVAVYILE